MPPWTRRLASWLLYPIATRERRLTSLTMLVVLAAYLAQYKRGLTMHTAPHGDGFFSWVFATSLALDGDIDFTNDYTLCGRGDLLVDQGGGRPENPYYVGPALVLGPVLWVARLLVRLPAGAPAAIEHACSGPLPQAVGWAAPFFTTLTVWLAYRVARRWAPQPYALAGALVGAFGTTLVTYGAPIWFYSHLWSAFAIALVLLAFVRATERADSAPRWALYGLAVAFAALVRPQEGVFVSLALVWAISEVLGRGLRDSRRRVAVAAAATAAGFASLYWVQLVVYKKLYGVYWLVPQGKLFVQPAHAHPFLMLFAGYSGWFTWTPLVWIGVLGLGRMALGRRTRAFGVALLVASALEIYVSSSALAWQGSSTWGQRFLTSLAAPVVVGAAVFGRSFGEWVRRRTGRARFVIVLAATAPLMFATWGTPFVNPATTRGSAVYGAAVSQNFKDIDEKIGNPFTLPATEVFARRYGVPRQKLDDLAFTGHFVRHYRTAATQAYGSLSFASPPEWFVAAEGMTLDKTGARIRRGRGRFLLTLYWPWVTHIRLAVTLHEARPTTIHLYSRGFALGRRLGTMTYAPGAEELEWALPKDGLDSGINEITVTTDADVTLRAIEFIDRTPHDLTLH